MFTSQTSIRVHYALTDQMGMVYYGNYAQFFEIARTEAIRQLGITYKSMEELGILMPVSEMHLKFRKGIRYDELITVKVSLTEWPVRRKITFDGEIFNEAGELATTGQVTLLFVEASSLRPVLMPEPLHKALAPFFEPAP